MASSEAWELSADASRDVGTISISPEGASIAYDTTPVGESSGTRSYVLDRATGESTLVVADEGREVYAPKWSPDGSRLLVTIGLEGYRPGVGGTQSVASLLPYQAVVEWRGRTVVSDPIEGTDRVLVTDGRGVDGTTGDVEERWPFGEPFWVD